MLRVIVYSFAVSGWSMILFVYIDILRYGQSIAYEKNKSVLLGEIIMAILIIASSLYMIFKEVNTKRCNHEC